jgi:hypothetical protein
VTNDHRDAQGTFHVGAALAGVIFAILGALFLLDALDVASIQRDLVLPVVLIALGLALMFGTMWRPGRERRGD